MNDYTDFKENFDVYDEVDDTIYFEVYDMDESYDIAKYLCRNHLTSGV